MCRGSPTGWGARDRACGSRRRALPDGPEVPWCPSLRTWICVFCVPEPLAWARGPASGFLVHEVNNLEHVLQQIREPGRGGDSDIETYLGWA